jgi:hypothetical protein
MLDGTVFKMWYSFVTLFDFRSGLSICDQAVSIGYATSSDGFYWVRSPGNNKGKATWSGGTGWDAGLTAFLANTPLPADGHDPASGVTLYYTTVRHLGDPTTPCVTNGIGRATRP